MNTPGKDHLGSIDDDVAYKCRVMSFPTVFCASRVCPSLTEHSFMQCLHTFESWTRLKPQLGTISLQTFLDRDRICEMHLLH